HRRGALGVRPRQVREGRSQGLRRDGPRGKDGGQTNLRRGTGARRDLGRHGRGGEQGQKRRLFLSTADPDLDQREEAYGAQPMRGSPMRAMIAVLGITLFAASSAKAQDVTDDFERLSASALRSLHVGPVKLRTSLSSDPDTIWIG